MSPETRSAVMARIKGKNTRPEQRMAAALAAQGVEWESHASDLPGCPDFVFRHQKVVVFVDGDFWHGWRFREWRDKLSKKWEVKIDRTRRRDIRNRRQLRGMGWKVVRLWEHQVAADIDGCVARVATMLGQDEKLAVSAWLENGEPGKGT